MADVLADQYIEILDKAEEEMELMMTSIPEVENFYKYVPETVPSNTVCMFFDDQAQEDFTTNRGMRRSFEWELAIYVHGQNREDMQRRMKLIILKLKARLADNPKLNRTFSRPVVIDNRFGAPRPVQVGEGAAALLKRYTLSGEVAD